MRRASIFLSALSMAMLATVALVSCDPVAAPNGYQGRSTCGVDADCNYPNACVSDGSILYCGCRVGSRGATCALHSDCVNAGGACDGATCQCVGVATGGSGGSGGSGGGGSGGEGGSGGASAMPKPCTTIDDCVRQCDCDGDGSDECVYHFACESGYCYDAPPDNGYNYATCEDTICGYSLCE